MGLWSEARSVPQDIVLKIKAVFDHLDEHLEGVAVAVAVLASQD